MRVLLWLLCAALSAGCFETLESDSPFYFAGDAFRADGSPFANATLALRRTGGTAHCDLIDGFSPFQDVQTDAVGHFVKEVLFYQTQVGRTGSGRCFELTLPEESGGVQTRLIFDPLYGHDVPLPETRNWAAGLAVTREGGALRVAANAYRDGSTGSRALWLRQGDLPVWHTRELTLPEVLLEDFAPLTASIVGELDDSMSFPRSGTLAFSERAQGGRVGLTAATARPPSRGAPCWLEPPPAQPSAPCGLTDGALEQVQLGGVSSVELQLDPPRTLRRLAVRGLVAYAQKLILEASADGATWTALGELPLPQPPSFQPLPDGGAPEALSRLPENPAEAERYLQAELIPALARYVRLRAVWAQGQEVPQAEGQLFTLRELSLYEE